MKKMACNIFFSLIVMTGVALAETASKKDNKSVWREDFKTMPAEWVTKLKPGTKPAEFSVTQASGSENGCLNMKADNASATFMIKLKTIDLHKTPILRWRWRVTTFPKGADGRNSKKDDQAIGIYVSHGGFLNQHSIAYRWETETPVKSEGTSSYAAGVVKVKWICLRNKNDGEGKTFFIEERNVAEDFKNAFGYIPDKIGVGVSCNSQYTESQAVAQLDWIELLPKESGNHP